MDRTEPLVSVIIPTYNRSHCIRRAIDSALTQQFPLFEIIVVDDGSSDDTAALVGRITDTRVRYVKKPNGGCSSARNVGVTCARGKYVAFLDSDDEWSPQWLQTAVGLMERDRMIGAVYGSLQLVSGEGRTTGVLDLTLDGRHGEATVAYVLSRCAGLLGSNVVARRRLVESIGGWDESFPTSGDLDFGLRLAVAARVALVREPLIRLVETRGSLSKKVNSGNRLRVLDKFAAAHPLLARDLNVVLRRSRAAILCSYGEDLLWFSRITEAEALLASSWRTRPSARALWLITKARAMKIAGIRAAESST